MTDLREAAQMALDAKSPEEWYVVKKAIRAALAQCDCDNPKQCWEPCGELGKSAEHAQQDCVCDSPDWCKQYKKCHRAVVGVEQAQPEQEPEPYCYTWDVWISGGYWEARYGWEPYCGGKRPAHSTEAKPLYTAPPQRKFIGLTDEEIEDACWTEVDQRMRSFARAIEAKLREKNHG